MKPANELTKEEIAPALAEAQGWRLGGARHESMHWLAPCEDRSFEKVCFWQDYIPLANNDQYNALTLNPEIHTGMIDVLQYWFGEHYVGSLIGDFGYWHNPEYLQDIRLWQLRATVEVLRRGKE